MKVLQVRLGPVRALVDAKGTSWRSAIAKEECPAPVFVGVEGLRGDQVADRRNHGGPDQALLAYADSHYAAWHQEGLAFPRGSFGENLLMEGATDQDVCVGDVWQAGSVRLQVSQPRQPCGTLARHLDSSVVVGRVWSEGRGGWYLRVLQTGQLGSGPVELLERPHADWTIARVLRAFADALQDPAEARLASRLGHLSPRWRQKLAAKAG